MTNLQRIKPKNHVLVTSWITVAGKQNTSTNKSAAAKFIINILVTVLEISNKKNKLYEKQGNRFLFPITSCFDYVEWQ